MRKSLQAAVLAIVAFTLSGCSYNKFTTQEQAVKNYIASQHEHHRKEDFKSELLRLLRAHGIEFEEKYVFD